MVTLHRSVHHRSSRVALLYAQLGRAAAKLSPDRQQRLMEKIMSQSNLVETLRHEIKASGITHYKLGKLCNISPAILDRFMNDERDLRLATAAKIAEVIGVKLVSKKRRTAAK